MQSRLIRLAGAWWPPLLLIALAFIFWGGALRPEEGRTLYGFDLERLFHPFGVFMFDAFRRGELPLWNPYFFLGFPQYAEPQISTFYPLTWPLAWLDPRLAFPLQYAVHFAWASLGGYALVRRLGGRRSGALLGGIATAYALTMTVRIFVGHLPHIMTLAWVPWILAAADWAVARRTWPATMLAAVPLALAFLIGYIPFLLYVVIGLTIFMGWQAWRVRGDGRGAVVRVAGQWVVLGGFAALLAGIQLIPTTEFYLYSNRAADRYNFANSFPIELNLLLTALLPNLFGAPVGPTSFWLNLPDAVYWEWAIYVGVLPLLLFGLAWRFGRVQWRFWFGLGAFGLLWAIGDAGVLNRLFYDYVPGMDGFRFVGRAVYFFSLAVIVVGGLMFDHWFDQPAETHAPRAAGLRRVLIIFIPASVLLILATVLWQAAQSDPSAIGRISGIAAELTRAALLITASIALLIWGHGRPRWQVTAVAVLLIVVDLWGVGNRFITDQRNETDLAWRTADVGLPPDRLDYRVMTRGLPENDGYYHGFYAVYGYDGFTLEASEVYNDLTAWDARIVRLLSARYLIHSPDFDAGPTAPGWRLSGEPAGGTFYEREDAGPRAFVVHDVWAADDADHALRLMAQPELDFTRTAVVEVVPDTQCALEATDAVSSAAIATYEPQRVVIQVEAAAAGWLVLNDMHYPGWRATVDGAPATIQPTNYALRGVCVPPGASQVEMTFQPRILTLGAAVSGVALALLAGAGTLDWRRRRADDAAA